MTSDISVAILGFWHVHAKDYAKSVVDGPNTTISAVWDPDPSRGREAAETLGVEFVKDLDSLLAKDDLDAVIVTTATSQHYSVIRKAIKAGKHVFAEKLLAPTATEAEELVREAERSGIKLVVSLPWLSNPAVIAAKEMIDTGSLGQVTYSRIRMAHDGWVRGWLPERFGREDEAVGGALSDLGCHPVYLTQFLLGSTPSTVSATYTKTTGRTVEDNAVVIARYPTGAIGVIEASFVATPGAFTIELAGSKGSLTYGFGSTKLLMNGGPLATGSWNEVAPASERPGPFDEWLRHIRSGTRADTNLRAAVELSRLVSAANQAAANGKTIIYRENSEHRADTI